MSLSKPTKRNRSPRYRLYSVGEILTMILESPASYPVQVVDNTLIHRRAEHAVRVDLSWAGQRYKAIIFTRSSDWYRYSLHLYADAEIELVVAGTHDSCLPLPVLSLDSLLATGQGKSHIALVSPHPAWFDAMQTRWPIKDISDAFRKTEYGHAMLIGGLMCKVPEAYERLGQIASADTRVRISREVQRLQHRRKGHPIKIFPKPLEAKPQRKVRL
jgi:hypothetical protein